MPSVTLSLMLQRRSLVRCLMIDFQSPYFLAEKKPELVGIFTPKWDPGCRRATPGVEYHKALQEDNVEVFRAG
jgi:hypothetical protein